MIFYYAPKTVAMASHIALAEAGAEYESRELNFAEAEQQSTDYLAVNPKGRVPALVTEQGILTETPAILTFIGQRFPDAELVPANDPFKFARIQEFNAYLCATVHVAHAHRVRGIRWADDEAAIASMQAKVQQNMTDYFKLIEAEMFAGPWVMGDDYTICDPYLFTVSNWLAGDGVDINSFPAIADFNRRMRERDAVKPLLELYGLK